MGALAGRAPAPNEPLMDAGLDSLTSVDARADVSERFGVRLPATALFDYPTAATLARHVASILAPEASVHQSETRVHPRAFRIASRSRADAVGGVRGERDFTTRERPRARARARVGTWRPRGFANRETSRPRSPHSSTRRMCSTASSSASPPRKPRRAIRNRDSSSTPSSRSRSPREASREPSRGVEGVSTRVSRVETTISCEPPARAAGRVVVALGDGVVRVRRAGSRVFSLRPSRTLRRVRHRVFVLARRGEGGVARHWPRGFEPGGGRRGGGGRQRPPRRTSSEIFRAAGMLSRGAVQDPRRGRRRVRSSGGVSLRIVRPSARSRRRDRAVSRGRTGDDRRGRGGEPGRTKFVAHRAERSVADRGDSRRDGRRAIDGRSTSDDPSNARHGDAARRSHRDRRGSRGVLLRRRRRGGAHKVNLVFGRGSRGGEVVVRPRGARGGRARSRDAVRRRRLELGLRPGRCPSIDQPARRGGGFRRVPPRAASDAPLRVERRRGERVRVPGHQRARSRRSTRKRWFRWYPSRRSRFDPGVSNIRVGRASGARARARAERVSPGTASFEVSVETTRGAAGSGFMDHRVAGRAIFPAAGMLRVALDATRAATRRANGVAERTALTNASVPAPLLSPARSRVIVRVGGFHVGHERVALVSASHVDGSVDAAHLDARPRVVAASRRRGGEARSFGEPGAEFGASSERFRARARVPIDPDAAYRAFGEYGLQYGAGFRPIGALRTSSDGRFVAARIGTAGARGKTRRRRVSWTAPRKSPRRSKSLARRFAFPRRSKSSRRTPPIRCIRIAARAETPGRRFAARACPTTRSTRIRCRRRAIDRSDRATDTNRRDTRERHHLHQRASPRSNAVRPRTPRSNRATRRWRRSIVAATEWSMPFANRRGRNRRRANRRGNYRVRRERRRTRLGAALSLVVLDGCRRRVRRRRRAIRRARTRRRGRRERFRERVSWTPRRCARTHTLPRGGCSRGFDSGLERRRRFFRRARLSSTRVRVRFIATRRGTVRRFGDEFGDEFGDGSSCVFVLSPLVFSSRRDDRGRVRRRRRRRRRVVSGRERARDHPRGTRRSSIETSVSRARERLLDDDASRLQRLFVFGRDVSSSPTRPERCRASRGRRASRRDHLQPDRRRRSRGVLFETREPNVGGRRRAGDGRGVFLRRVAPRRRGPG